MSSIRCLSLFLMLALVVPALAQVQQGSVGGVVVDGAGIPVSGATLALRDPANNQQRSATSASDGAFRIANVPPSVYELHVEAAGLAPYDQGVQIVVGQSLRITVRMAPMVVSASTEVTAEQPGLDRTDSAAATVVDTDRIEELPVQSRNYLEFVLLAPGVTSTRAASGAASLLGDSGFSFAGLRPRSNTLTIDGLANDDEFSGASRTELSLETIKEFQVAGHSWSAENGGGSGGSINVVTRSGTNAIHGDAFVIAQSGRLNARPFLENLDGKPSSNRERAGGALGGAAVKDRVFYYLSAERERMRGQSASDVDPSVVSTINAALGSSSSPFGRLRPLTAGRFPIALDETEAAGKVNAQLDERNSVMARLAMTSTRDRNDAFGTGGLTDFSSRGSSATHDLAATGSWMAIVGSAMTNDLRGQLARRTVALDALEEQGPGVDIPGVVAFGRPYDGVSDHRQRYAEVGDTFGYAIGSHFLRVGADVLHIDVDGTSGVGRAGLYVFRSVDAFLRGEPDSYRQSFGDPSVHLRATREHLFVQDEWTHATLSVTAGVRLDDEVLPAQFHMSDRQVSPRVGFAWSPDAAWVVRGGAGSFADRIPLAALERASVLDGSHGFEQILDSAAATRWLALHGGAADAPFAGVAPSIDTVRPGDCHSSSRQASLGAERALTPLLSVSANLLVARGNHLLRTVNVNLPPPAIVDGQPRFGSARIDPSRTEIFELQPTASSRYRGLTLGLNRRLFQEIEWSAAYTWSKTTDDASDFDEQPANPYNLAAERSPSRFDQRHRLVASALIELGDTEDAVAGSSPSLWSELLSNVELAPIVTVESGRPANPVIGVDAYGTGSYPATARPSGVARNSERLPATASVNLRLLKFFPLHRGGRVDVVVEAFNLLNRRNVTERNMVFGSGPTAAAGFGHPLDAEPARQIEFSLDYEF